MNIYHADEHLNADSYVFFALESYFLRYCDNLIDVNGVKLTALENPRRDEWIVPGHPV